MERTKSEGLFGRDRLANWGASRKRIRFKPNDGRPIKKKQKVSTRRSGQVGLQAKIGGSACTLCGKARWPCSSSDDPVVHLPDPVDQVLSLWTNKTGLKGGFGGKRSCALWRSGSLVLLQLDPLNHHFDPEGQVPTLWVSSNW